MAGAVDSVIDAMTAIGAPRTIQLTEDTGATDLVSLGADATTPTADCVEDDEVLQSAGSRDSLFSEGSVDMEASQGVCLRSVVDLDTGHASLKWSFAPSLVQHFYEISDGASSGGHSRLSLSGSEFNSSSSGSASASGSKPSGVREAARVSLVIAASNGAAHPAVMGPTFSPKLSFASSRSTSSNSMSCSSSRFPRSPFRSQDGLQLPDEPLTLEPPGGPGPIPSDGSSSNLNSNGNSHSSSSLTNSPLSTPRNSSSNIVINNSNSPSKSSPYSLAGESALVAAAAAAAFVPPKRPSSRRSLSHNNRAPSVASIVEEEGEADIEANVHVVPASNFYRSYSGSSAGNCHTSTTSSGHADPIFTSEENFGDLFPELVTFTGSEELLRGSSLNFVMRCRGSIFANSIGSAETFGLSREVPHLHTFISHNWSTSRGKKFLGISHHFNFRGAQLGAFITLAIVVVLSVSGYAPMIPHKGWPQPVGYLGRSLVYPIFIIFLFFQRDLALLFRWHGPDVFLDKTCIHQVDASLKQRGIEKLPAFLSKSHYMLALYTDATYLQKMWTVYEVAAFLALRPSRNMFICELNSVQLFYATLFAAWLSTVVIMVLATVVEVPVFVELVLGTIFCIAGLVVCRSWALSRASICERLQKFDVNECACTLETDRAVLRRNIAVLMRTRANIPNASEEEALAFFNNLARAELPQVFATALHPLAFSYSHVVTFTVLYSGTARVDLHMTEPNRSVESYMGEFCSLLIWWTIGMPLLYAAIQYVANSFLNRHGWRVWLRLLFLFVLVCEPFLGFQYLTIESGKRADTGSAVPWITLAALSVLGGAMLRVMYSDRFWRMSLRCK